MTSVGQCAPAQMRPMHAKTITNTPITHTTTRQRGWTCGVSRPGMKAGQVKKSASPLGSCTRSTVEDGHQVGGRALTRDRDFTISSMALPMTPSAIAARPSIPEKERDDHRDPEEILDQTAAHIRQGHPVRRRAPWNVLDGALHREVEA